MPSLPTRHRPRARRAFALATVVLALAAAIALALATARPAAAAPDPCLGQPTCSTPSPAEEPSGTAPIGTPPPPENACDGQPTCSTEREPPRQEEKPKEEKPKEESPKNESPGTGSPETGSPKEESTPKQGPEKAPPPPSTAPPAAPQEGEGAASNPDPLSHLGGESQSHPFPLDNYGLDEQVQWGITHLGNTFDRATQWAIQVIWQVMLYVFNGIMVMLQWAFSRDLLKNSLSKLAEALQTMRRTIDTPWGLAAIAGLGLWGIWNGLVRKKTIDTVRGLLVSLLMMAALLVVIGDPVDTLGQVDNIANGASTEMLDSITAGKVTEPQQAVGSTEQSLFKSVILRPWCALQFGDVDYCLSQPKGLNQPIANTWLQAPPDSQWRTSLWEITNAESEAAAREEEHGVNPPGKKQDLGDMYVLGGHPDKMAMIGGGNVMPRLGLLLLIGVGLLGAIVLFAYLAARLLLASLLVLVLVLFAPAMFLAAALGESGRATVVAWAGRLIGAIATKVIYALFLAVIVFGSNLVTDLKLGFFPTWIVFIAFWWGVLLKRKDLLALVALDHKGAAASGLDYNGASSGNALAEMFYAQHLLGNARRTLGRAAGRVTAAPRALMRRGTDEAKGRREASRQGQSDAARQTAHEELEREGRDTLERRNAAEHKADAAKGAKVLGLEKKLKLGLAEKDNEISDLRTKHGGKPPIAEAQRLQDERTALNKRLIKTRSSPGYARARSVGSKPRQVSDRDVQSWIAGRRSELAAKPGDDKNLHAAGIDPQAYRQAGSAEQRVDQEMSKQIMDRHRVLLDRAGVGHSGDERESLGRRELRQVRKEAGSSGPGREGKKRFRAASRERAKRHRQSFRNERRNEKRRRHVR